MNLGELTEEAVRAARVAGELIQSYRDRDVKVEHKAGGDTLASQVVTEVDEKAQAEILKILKPTCAAHDLALLTEEHEDDRGRLKRISSGASTPWTERFRLCRACRGIRCRSPWSPKMDPHKLASCTTP